MSDPMSRENDRLDELLNGTLALVIRAAWERGRMGQSEGTSDTARRMLDQRIRQLKDEALEAGYVRAKAEVAAQLIQQGAKGSIRV